MNPADRKPHSRSWLKNLPMHEDEALSLGRNPACTQAAIFALLREAGATLESVALQCLSRFAADGCDQAPGGLVNALSQWRPWYVAKMGNAITDAKISAIVEAEAARAGGKAQAWKDEKRREYFKVMSIANEDADTFALMDRNSIAARHGDAKLELQKRQAAQKDEEITVLKTREKRITCELFIEWSADERAKRILNSGASKADQIEALGQQMFGDDWNE